MKVTIEDISTMVIELIRSGVVFRFIFCMVRLQSAEEEAAQFRKRARNTVIFWIIAESIWQLKEIVLYYYT